MNLRHLLIITLLSPALALAAPKKARDTQDKPAKATRKNAESGAAVAARLRADWDLGMLKMMRQVIDEAPFDATIKTTAGDAMDKFSQQQEDLLTQVASAPEKEAQIVKQRNQYQAAFNQKMKAVNDSDVMRKEMARRLKAMDKEIDTMAKSADQIFAQLDAVGVTKAQKEKIQTDVKEASDNVKKTVDKSETRSTKDKKTREQVVAHWQKVHKKIRDNLTPEQREKLVKKLADE